MEAPQRMCLACRTMKDKRDLIRVVKSADGVKLDRTFKAAGRGAYICSDPECIGKVKKHRLLNKAFKCEVDESVYLAVEEAARER